MKVLIINKILILYLYTAKSPLNYIGTYLEQMFYHMLNRHVPLIYHELLLNVFLIYNLLKNLYHNARKIHITYLSDFISYLLKTVSLKDLQDRWLFYRNVSQHEFSIVFWMGVLYHKLDRQCHIDWGAYFLNVLQIRRFL